MRGDYSFLRPGKSAPEVDAPLRIGIAPTPDFTLMSLSCFVEFLRLSADESDFSRQIYCSWDLLSHEFSPIRSSCGFPMVPTRLFDDPSEYDYVVVHGGLLHSAEAIPDELYRFIQSCVEARVPVIGLCTGQFILAELGYLAGKRCAVHFSLAQAMQSNFPDVIAVTDAPGSSRRRIHHMPGRSCGDQPCNAPGYDPLWKYAIAQGTSLFDGRSGIRRNTGYEGRLGDRPALPGPAGRERRRPDEATNL
ncbi:DJ-1/PfpI family protein [Paraburkholderia dipogonis]|uniref:DJ-1/PfpI family protein n=1 Tax=Paraburkholderia dipogonis TaxID=1211383 RepID=UPI0035E5F4AF